MGNRLGVSLRVWFVQQNKRMRIIIRYLATICCCAILLATQAQTFPPLPSPQSAGYRLVGEIPPPPGYQRVVQAPGSFGNYLRQLPIKQQNNTVLLYNGRTKPKQHAQYAVLQIDVGKQNLQQCADAVMRLRAEYLYREGRHTDIHFHFTNGMLVDFQRYAQGWRVLVQGNKTTWVHSAQPDAGYASFRRYLDLVFTYAGTASLAKELEPVATYRKLEIGDVLIEAGSPGHAVLVVDVAENPFGQRVCMLLQSFMPAQEMHVLQNPESPQQPWYFLPENEEIDTPEWTFPAASLRRFPQK